MKRSDLPRALEFKKIAYYKAVPKKLPCHVRIADIAIVLIGSWDWWDVQDSFWNARILPFEEEC
jgi:hypothetical protein